MESIFLETIKQLRSALHRYPELSNCETDTIRILMGFLSEKTSLRIYPQQGWFCAVHFEKEPDPTLAVRADLDAIADSKGIPFHGKMNGLCWQR